jgi:uncharacterized protein (UPF0264 family)
MTVQLLVSVRSPQEAIAALNGGADIIDVKEPSKGSLGAASPDVIDQIVRLVRKSSPGAIVSAAMGEVHDHVFHENDSNAATHQINGQIDFLKCGLSGLRTDGKPMSWQHTWSLFRDECSVSDFNAQWVAVSYADWERSEAPAPLDIFAEGSSIGSPILLIDTFTKDDTTVLDWLDDTQLRELRDVTRAAEIKLAIAGRIGLKLLPQICKYSPDIVAIRGAACEQGDRTATVTAERVQSFQTQLARLLTSSHA